MKNNLILVASLGLALAFTFSCSSGGGGDDGGGSSSSSDDGNCNKGPLIKLSPCRNEPVTIGEQIWHKCNLNVAADSSRCYLDKPENCEIYGRLYDWATAMGFPPKCNTTSSANDADCNIKSPYHQGICPNGWHIPSKTDWDSLLHYIDDYYRADDYMPISVTAGWYLKARNGWNENGNGEDMYGFSALPGGNMNISPEFTKSCDIGYEGTWWSSKEWEEAYGYMANSIIMSYENGGAFQFPSDFKFKLLSVRCLKD